MALARENVSCTTQAAPFTGTVQGTNQYMKVIMIYSNPSPSKPCYRARGDGFATPPTTSS